MMSAHSARCYPGWKLSHDAIRYDMDAILAAIEKTVSLVGQAFQGAPGAKANPEYRYTVAGIITCAPVTVTLPHIPHPLICVSRMCP